MHGCLLLDHQLNTALKARVHSVAPRRVSCPEVNGIWADFIRAQEEKRPFSLSPLVGIGARDFDNTSDTRFVTIGLIDIPGMTYWQTS